MRQLFVLLGLMLVLAACGGPGWIGEDTLLPVEVSLPDPVGDATLLSTNNAESLREDFSVGQGFPERVTFAPESDMLVAAGATGIFVFENGDLEEAPQFLSGHAGAITEVQVAVDDTIYSSGADGTLRLWDIETGENELIFESESPISDFALHPDGEQIVFTHGKGIILIESVATTGGEARRIEDINTRSAVQQLRLSEDGSAVVVIYGDMMIFDVETGEQLARSTVTTRDAVFDGSGQLITAHRSAFSVYRTDNWERLISSSETRIFDDRAISTVIMPPTGAYAVFFIAGGENRAYKRVSAPFVADTWQVNTVTEMGMPVVDGDFKPDGSRFVTVHSDGSLSLWNPSFDITQTWTPGNSAILATAFSVDGETLYRIDNRLSVSSYDALSGELLAQTEGRFAVQNVQVTVSHDATKFLTQDAETTTVYEMATGDMIAEHKNETFLRGDVRVYMEIERSGNNTSSSSISYPFPTEAKFSLDDSEIIIATFGGFMRWDYENDRLTSPIWVRTDDIDDLMHVSYFPGGRYLLGGLEGANPFGIWDLEAEDITGTPHFISKPDKVNHIGSAISVQNQIAVLDKSSSRSGATGVRLIDPLSQEQIGAAHEVVVEFMERDVQLRFSPDGKLLVIGDAAGTLILIDTATGAEITRMAAHGGKINGLAFSPDGTRIASGGDDGVLRVWSAE